MKHTEKRLARISVALLVVILGFGSASTALARPVGQVNPTNEWVNFYGLNTILDGKPVPAGTVITAYDPQGTICGQFVVHTPGHYGLLACYRDDPNTPEDEGAEPGDNITFTMNGLGAAQHGPDDACWTGNGDLMQVELSAGAGAGPGGPSGTIRGTVFLDADRDGVRDPGESPIPGVTVTAISDGGYEIPLFSGDDGTFGFVAMRAAYWRLQVTVPDGYSASGPTFYTGIRIGGGSTVVLNKDFGLINSAPPLLPVTGTWPVWPVVALWLVAGGGLLAGVGLGLRRAGR